MKSRLEVIALSVLLGALVSSPVVAQVDQADMKARYESKLKKSFFKQATWFTDYDKARARAKESGRLIFTYFTRSYSP